MDKIWEECYSAQELYTGHLISPIQPPPQSLNLQNQLSPHLITPVAQDPLSVSLNTFSLWEPGLVSQCELQLGFLDPALDL